MEVSDDENHRRLTEMNRLSDLMVTRGLLALLVREVARLSSADPQTLDEWRSFAVEQMFAGGLVGGVLPRSLDRIALDRAADAISAILNQGPRDDLT